MKTLRVSGMLAGLLATATVALAQAKRPVTIDDLMRLKTVSDVQLSPDGSRVLYVVSVPNMAKNEHDSDIWMVSADGGDPTQLTTSPKSDGTPRWSPNGRVVAFVSTRDGPPNVYLLNLAGGEPKKLTDSPTGVQRFAWSPDGTQIAFVSADPPSEADKKVGEDNAGVIVVDEKFSMGRLRVIEVASGQVKTLTGTDRTVTGLSWTPDGSTIVFAAQPTPRASDSVRADLFRVPADGGAIVTLVAQEGPDDSSVVSPDGQWIAFNSAAGRSGIGQSTLYLVPTAGGTPRRAAPSYDNGFRDPTWAPNGKELYFASTIGVRMQIMRLTIATGAVTPITTGDRVHSAFSLSRDGTRMALLVQDPTTPAEIHVSPVATYHVTRLTRTNPQLDSLALGAIEPIRWKSKDGLEIEGLLLKPVGFKAGTRYPVLTYIHGGPRGVFTLSFSAQFGAFPIPLLLQTEPYPVQVFAGKGYAMLMPNPRGSSGYGVQFLRANVKDWGHGDFADIMTGLDHLVSIGIADPERLGLMGWSYGGYMTAWAITQTDRFKAASVGAGVPDLISFHGNDIPDVLRDYFGDRPWKVKERYENSSAIFFAQNIKTPTLIQHGEKDERVPLTQGWELYRALEANNVPREFAIYPRQGHVALEPKLQRDVLERNYNWFTRWVGERPVP